MSTSIAGKPESSGRRVPAFFTTARPVAGAQAGFSYVMVLAAVVVVGIVAEAAHLTTWRTVKADRETELLFRGDAYRRAIRSYYEAGTTEKTFPRALTDLIEDPRTPGKHHLRALYPDPMAPDKNVEWTLVRAADGGIAGVSSRSGDEPLKRANFPNGYNKFAGAASYSEWVFEYVPPPSKRKPLPGKTVAPPLLKPFGMR